MRQRTTRIAIAVLLALPQTVTISAKADVLLSCPPKPVRPCSDDSCAPPPVQGGGEQHPLYVSPCWANYNESHDRLQSHLDDFVKAHNFGRRLKTLKGLAPYEFIVKKWTTEPKRFKLDPLHQIPGLNT